MEDKGRSDKKSRRRRARPVLAALLQRVQQVCGSVDKVGLVENQIEDAAQRIREFAQQTDIKALLPDKVRRSLRDAADQFGSAKDQIDNLKSACKRVRQALRAADKALAAPFPLALAIAGAVGVAVVGVVVAGAVILTNNVTIVVRNVNCDNIEFTGVADFLPGVDFPGQIVQRTEGIVKVPKAFAGRFEASGQGVVLHAFGREVPVRVNKLNLERSTWDRTALTELEGETIAVKEGDTHALVIVCE